MDAQSRVRDVTPLVALIQSLARLELEGEPSSVVPSAEVLAENRFLAARDGMDARLIDPAARCLIPVERCSTPCWPSAARTRSRSGAPARSTRCRGSPAQTAPTVSAIRHAQPRLDELVASLADRFLAPHRRAAHRGPRTSTDQIPDRKERHMCRWLAYSGSPILMKEVLYGGTHSLVDQSLHSRLGAETTNGDGFGVGWYGAPDTPGMFHSTEPAWNDQNLRELAGHISSPLFFTHIRAAIGSAVQQTNCHPFRHDRWLFMHNGYINEFATIKRDLVLAVDPSLYPRDPGPGRHRGAVLPRAHLRPRGRPAGRGRAGDRVRRSGRRAPRSAAPVPGHRRDHRRREHLGVPLLQRAQVAHAVLHHRRPHAAQALPGAGRCSRNSPTTRG